MVKAPRTVSAMVSAPLLAVCRCGALSPHEMARITARPAPSFFVRRETPPHTPPQRRSAPRTNGSGVLHGLPRIPVHFPAYHPGSDDERADGSPNRLRGDRFSRHLHERRPLGSLQADAGAGSPLLGRGGRRGRLLGAHPARACLPGQFDAARLLLRPRHPARGTRRRRAGRPPHDDGVRRRRARPAPPAGRGRLFPEIHRHLRGIGA